MKYDQIHNFLRIWSQLLKKPFMENYIFSAVIVIYKLLRSTYYIATDNK